MPVSALVQDLSKSETRLMKRLVRIKHSLKQKRNGKQKHPRQEAISTNAYILNLTTKRQNNKRMLLLNQVSSSLSTRKLSTTRSWARTRIFTTVLFKCEPKLSMHNKALEPWRKKSRNSRTMLDKSAKKALTTIDRLQKQIIRF